MVDGNLRIPPQSLDAEKSVLGSMMLSKDAIEISLGKLKSENVFYRGAHGKIFNAILSLHEKNETVDILTLSEELQKMGDFAEIGGQTYLTEILSSVPSAASVGYYIKIVLEKYKYRQLIHQCGEVINVCFEARIPVNEIYDTMDTKMLTGRLHKGNSIISLADGIGIVVDRLEKMESGAIKYIQTSFVGLNRIIGGLKPGEFTLWAGRPSHGKTQSALVAGIEIAKAGTPVLYFSYEMGKDPLSSNIVAYETGINKRKIVEAKLNEHDYNSMGEDFTDMRKIPFYMSTDSTQNVFDIRSTTRQAIKKYGVGIIFIDYMTLIPEHKKFPNRNAAVGEQSRLLKQTAEELQIPIVVLSQLNRLNTQRSNKEPMLSDLRESGNLEQDADNVIFVYRPGYDEENGVVKVKHNGTEHTVKDYAALIVKKNRSLGTFGRVHLKFLPEFNKYTEIDFSHFENDEGVVDVGSDFPWGKNDKPF